MNWGKAQTVRKYIPALDGADTGMPTLLTINLKVVNNVIFLKY